MSIRSYDMRIEAAMLTPREHNVAAAAATALDSF